MSNFNDGAHVLAGWCRLPEEVRSGRAYLAGLGTAGSLVAGAAVLFVLAGAVISFAGWPEIGDQPAPTSVAVGPSRNAHDPDYASSGPFTSLTGPEPALSARAPRRAHSDGPSRVRTHAGGDVGDSGGRAVGAPNGPGHTPPGRDAGSGHPSAAESSGPSKPGPNTSSNAPRFASAPKAPALPSPSGVANKVKQTTSAEGSDLQQTTSAVSSTVTNASSQLGAATSGATTATGNALGGVGHSTAEAVGGGTG